MKSRGRQKAGGNDGEFTELEQLPNIGPAIAGYLRSLGVVSPRHLKGRDPYQMYDELCRITGRRFDPCLLDVFIATVRFVDGAPARPWWKYTAERKRVLKAREKSSRA